MLYRFRFTSVENVFLIYVCNVRRFQAGKSCSRLHDGPDDRLMLIKKIKLLIAALRNSASSSLLLLSLSFLVYFSFYLLLNSRTKQTWPLRASHWYQSFLMSAWLIGRNFINARSIEIGGDIGEVHGWRTATRFYVSTWVFIKYDDCSLWRYPRERYSRIGKIDRAIRVAMRFQSRRLFLIYKSYEWFRERQFTVILF